MRRCRHWFFILKYNLANFRNFHVIQVLVFQSIFIKLCRWNIVLLCFVSGGFNIVTEMPTFLPITNFIKRSLWLFEIVLVKETSILLCCHTWVNHRAIFGFAVFVFLKCTFDIKVCHLRETFNLLHTCFKTSLKFSSLLNLVFLHSLKMSELSIVVHLVSEIVCNRDR